MGPRPSQIAHHGDGSDTSKSVLFRRPSFVTPHMSDAKVKLPQCIAHRGYKAKYPENTLAAFRGAISAGAHALETDLHLTKDGVIVLSHDTSLQRCFGRPERIIDCRWDEIKDFRTIAEPHETMPRLRDLLSLLAQPAYAHIWLFLDIKLDDDPDDMMRLIASTIASVPAFPGRSWEHRIILGLWAARYLPLARKYSPSFAVFNTAHTVLYARHFFSVPDVGFNINLAALVGPFGGKFLRDAHSKYHRQVLAWTVNHEDRMLWCIRKGLDGVITDDPAKFIEVCEGYDPTKRLSRLSLTLKSYHEIARLWFQLVAVFLLQLYPKRLVPFASRKVALGQYGSSEQPSR